MLNGFCMMDTVAAKLSIISIIIPTFYNWLLSETFHRIPIDKNKNNSSIMGRSRPQLHILFRLSNFLSHVFVLYFSPSMGWIDSMRCDTYFSYCFRIYIVTSFGIGIENIKITIWGRGTHIYVSALGHIVSDNGFSSVAGEFPAQRASNAENVSIWWRHHAKLINNNKTKHRKTVCIFHGIYYAFKTISYCK